MPRRARGAARSALAQMWIDGTMPANSQVAELEDAPKPRAPAPADAPPGLHLLAKSTGSTGNIDCAYCLFLSKEALYPSEKHRMSEASLRRYFPQLLESHRTVTIARWRANLDGARLFPPIAVVAERAPYSLCPCGDGAKFRFRHGARAPRSPVAGSRVARQFSQATAQ